MSTNKGIRKTIYFGENEGTILSYALSQSNSFAAYVKSLITKDMQKEPLEKTIIKIVEAYLTNNNICINKNTDTQPKGKFDEDDINALNMFMKRS